jgi:membrane-bound lytic murein transglycosylase B
MIDPSTPDALKAIASMMRMEGYRTDATGVEALVLDNAADEIEKLRDAITAAIKEAKQPHYGDKYIQLDNYDDAILILEKVLEEK